MSLTRANPSTFTIDTEDINADRLTAIEEYLGLYMPSRTNAELITEFTHYKGYELDQLSDVELQAKLAADYPDHTFPSF